MGTLQPPYPPTPLRETQGRPNSPPPGERGLLESTFCKGIGGIFAVLSSFKVPNWPLKRAVYPSFVN